MSSCAELTEAGRTLVLRDRVTVVDAQALHALALQAASSGGSVTVDATGLRQLDTAAAQVLIALAARLSADGHVLAWHGLAEAPARYLARGGLLALLHAEPA